MRCMYVKEGLYFFNKHTGELIGYLDLWETNDVLADYEQQLNTADTTPQPLGKCMLMFMVRGLFTPLKFPCVQFVAASTKVADVNVFPLVRQAVKHLTCLGLIVTTITCDGASDTCFRCLTQRLICLTRPSMFLAQKEEKSFSSLICLICSRQFVIMEKLWVCGCINFRPVCTVLFSSVLGKRSVGI